MRFVFLPGFAGFCRVLPGGFVELVGSNLHLSFFVIEQCRIFAKGTYQFYTGRYVGRCENLTSVNYGRGGLLD
jgi:hypothetical protein